MPALISIEPAATLPLFNSEFIQKRAELLLELCGRPAAELSLLLTSDSRIAELNGRYRGKKGPTNVLAFPLAAGPDAGMAGNLLGDIVISVETARREAQQEGISLHQRLTALMIHGLLHLLGYDHERHEEAELMFRKEKELVRQLRTKRRKEMVKLAVNVDHVATLRQARGKSEPDPVLAAGICELAGASGIVVHLREDRRHIQDRDVLLLRQTIKSKLNLEMAAAEEIIKFALKIKPDMITLVPEKRQELTTEGGLNVAGQQKKLKDVVARMNRANIPVSIFIDPDSRQIKASKNIGATFVEIHTGGYCEANSDKTRDREFKLIVAAAEEAYEAGLLVNAGHGLDYLNTPRVAALEMIDELSIGHAIMTRAIFVGLDQAVREMLALLPY